MKINKKELARAICAVEEDHAGRIKDYNTLELFQQLSFDIRSETCIKALRLLQKCDSLKNKK